MCGSTQRETDAEFTYLLDGEMIANGVQMTSGHAYAAEAGTTHHEFRTDTGGTVISVFPLPER